MSNVRDRDDCLRKRRTRRLCFVVRRRLINELNPTSLQTELFFSTRTFEIARQPH